MKKLLLAVIAIFFVFSSSFSQIADNNDRPSGPWTLEECINFATRNNIRVIRSQLDLDQSRANLSQSRAALYPTLNASGTHSYAFGRTIDPVENRFVEETIQSNQFSLNSGVVLFSGLQNQNNIRRNRFLTEANLAALEQARNDVSINVAGAYLQVLLNKELLDMSRFQFNATAEQVTRTERLVEAGALPRASYLDIRAQNATDELAVINAENQLDISKLQLMQLLQLPYDQQFDIVDPEVTDVDNYNLQQRPFQIYQIALETQPIMRSMRLFQQSAQLGETIAKGGNFPVLRAFANINTYYTNRLDPIFSFSQQLDNHLGQNLGFQLNVPIFNNWNVRNEIQRARITSRNAEINTLETQNNLRQEVEQAYLDARAALKTYNSVQNQLEALQEAFRVTEQRFNLGAANAVDYNVSRNNLNRAESDYIRARYDYIFRMKVLDFYQGKTLTLD